MIEQKELLKYQAVVQQVEEKRKKFKVVEAALEDMENGLIARLKAKEEQERGKWRGVVKTSKGRASIQWKEEVVKLKGKAFVEQLLMDAVRDDVYELEVVEAAK